MYNRTIEANVSIITDYMIHRAPPTMHMLLCTYSLLKQWEHIGLSSSYWRWYWNDRPGASVTFNHVRTKLGPSQVVLIPPNTAFSTHTDNPVGHLHCHFWFGLRVCSDSARPVTVKINGMTRRRLQTITKLMIDERPKFCHPKAWLSIHSILTESLSHADLMWDTKEPDEVIDQVRQRLHHASPRNKLSNSAIAREAGLSVNTLLRRFRKAFGSSPQQFLIQLRIELAAQLMRSTDLSIPEIADRCGFVDRYHLSRVFMSHASVSPAAYRSATRRVNRDWAQAHNIAHNDAVSKS